jgi:hypothetical protein
MHFRLTAVSSRKDALRSGTPLKNVTSAIKSIFSPQVFIIRSYPPANLQKNSSAQKKQTSRALPKMFEGIFGKIEET